MHRTERTDLTDLTDDALVARVSTLCAEGYALTARLIVLLIEVEERRLDLRSACTSMFDYCQRRLGMSGGAAYRRITAARLVKRFPALLQRIETGEIHLSTLVLLRPHLDEQNVHEIAAAVVGKTKRQVEELLARIAPKADLPSTIVELAAASNDASATVFADRQADSGSSTPRAARARIEPLSEARYGVQLTASAELKAKLERACDLMRHRNPRGDLAVVIDAALDLLLAKLEKERLAKVKTPRKASSSRRPRGVPAAVRREVFERDSEQCTFVDESGARCPQRGHLELDHVEARALGGTNAAENLRVRCRAHNRLAAEDVFGKAHVAERIYFRQRKSRAVAQPVLAAPPPPAIELALRGLHNLGFKKSDARRAVDQVSRRCVAAGQEPDVQTVLRGALATLTC